MRTIVTVYDDEGGVTKTTFPPVLPAGEPVSVVLIVTPSVSIVCTPDPTCWRMT